MNINEIPSIAIFIEEKNRYEYLLNRDYEELLDRRTEDKS